MRITKKMLREAKAALLARMSELSEGDALSVPMDIDAEYSRLFPHAEQKTPTRMKRRMILGEAIEKAIPDHLCY